jgi:hypothetical protein
LNSPARARLSAGKEVPVPAAEDMLNKVALSQLAKADRSGGPRRMKTAVHLEEIARRSPSVIPVTSLKHLSWEVWQEEMIGDCHAARPGHSD